jgi:amino acid transporter
MSAFGNFALSFSVISILTGAVSLYGYGLTLGGPIQMSVGWPAVAGMTCLVALSLAELASAFPTAGGLYHWSLRLGGPTISWFTAWFNLVGQIAVVAGVDFALADFLRPALGLPDSRTWGLAVYAAVLASHGLLNHVGIRAVTLLNEASAWYHLVGTALLVGAILWLAPLRPLSFLVERYSGPAPDGVTYPFAYACLAGLLSAQWTFTGYDASAHAAEETVHAQEAAPRGMVTAVLVSGVAGSLMVACVTLAVKDLPAAAAAPNAFLYVIEHALGPRLGPVMVWMVVLAIWFCGLSAVTSNSRMLFAFARDGGAPGSIYLSRVSDRFRTPAMAVWTCVVTAFLLAIWSRAYSVIVSISTIGLYSSYGIPILLLYRARGRGELKLGPYRLGRAAKAINLAALLWIGFITVLFVLPPNQLTGYTFGGLLVLLVGYAALNRGGLFAHGASDSATGRAGGGTIN